MGLRSAGSGVVVFAFPFLSVTPFEHGNKLARVRFLATTGDSSRPSAALGRGRFFVEYANRPRSLGLDRIQPALGPAVRPEHGRTLCDTARAGFSLLRRGILEWSTFRHHSLSTPQAMSTVLPTTCTRPCYLREPFTAPSDHVSNFIIIVRKSATAPSHWIVASRLHHHALFRLGIISSRLASLQRLPPTSADTEIKLLRYCTAGSGREEAE